MEKRAAILLDKIMYAVQKALDEDRNGKGTAAQHGNIASFTSVSHMGRNISIFIFFDGFYQIFGEGLNSSFFMSIL